MPYIAWNNGHSWQWHDPSENYQLQAGEIEMGREMPTDDELRAVFPHFDDPVEVA